MIIIIIIHCTSITSSSTTTIGTTTATVLVAVMVTAAHGWQVHCTAVLVVVRALAVMVTVAMVTLEEDCTVRCAVVVMVTLVKATLVEDCAVRCAVGVMVTGLLLAIEDVFAILMLIMAAVSDNSKGLTELRFDHLSTMHAGAALESTYSPHVCCYLNVIVSIL